MDYEDMLNKAREELPDSIHQAERFEIPKVKGHIQGNKTILSNFNEIANSLGRDPNHLLKFILKEIAAPGSLNNGTVNIGSKIPASRINEKIRQYAKIYVICPECGKPDTNIVKEKNINFLKCTACGAKTSIKSKI